MEVDKPMHSIESPTTTQPTEAATAEGDLTELLGTPARSLRPMLPRLTPGEA